MLSKQSEETILKMRSRLVSRMWNGMAFLAVIAVPASVLRSLQTGWLHVYSFHVAIGIFIASIYCLRHRLSYQVKSMLLISLFISIGSIGLIALGLLGAGIWWLVVSSLLVYILYSARAGLISVLFTMIFSMVCGALYTYEIITLPVDANQYITSFSSWISLLIAITLMPLVVFQAIGVYQDSIFILLAKIEAQRAEIERVGMHDQLTDLATLNLTEDRFKIASSLAIRNNSKVALLFIDLDGFKGVNDTHGHEAGDNLLIEVAKHLKNICRAEDTASRIGGDEFILLLSEITTAEEACSTAQRVVDVLSEPVFDGDRTLQVGASVGVSVFPDHASDLKLLRKMADKAMYGIKKSGKNGWQLYAPTTEKTA